MYIAVYRCTILLKNNLNEKTQSVLTQQDINTLDVLKELSTEDIKSPGLTIGQRTLFESNKVVENAFE